MAFFLLWQVAGEVVVFFLWRDAGVLVKFSAISWVELGWKTGSFFFSNPEPTHTSSLLNRVSVAFFSFQDIVFFVGFFSTFGHKFPLFWGAEIWGVVGPGFFCFLPKILWHFSFHSTFCMIHFFCDEWLPQPLPPSLGNFANPPPRF